MQIPSVFLENPLQFGGRFVIIGIPVEQSGAKGNEVVIFHDFHRFFHSPLKPVKNRFIQPFGLCFTPSAAIFQGKEVIEWPGVYSGVTCTTSISKGA